jgi:hypothetical protein
MPTSTHRLRAAIHYWLRSNDPAFDTRLYSHDEWLIRHESFGNDAPLTMVAGTPMYRVLNTLAGPEGIDLEQAFSRLLKHHGYLYELGYAWSVHFHPLKSGTAPLALTPSAKEGDQ